MIDAIAGAKYVVHTASPFPLKAPKDENELIEPAVNGTLAAMRGAEKHGVTRVVITSSVAAVMTNKDPKKTHFNDQDWTDLTIAKAYEKSKTLAEKAAWDFVEAQPEGKKIELATVNPGFVLGPNLNKCHFSSGDVIRQFVDGSIPMYPLVSMPIVDVRDVAEAHLQAILKPEAVGKRYLMVAETMMFGEFAKILSEKYGEEYKIPKK